MSDLAAWARKQGLDLNAHLERIREEGVRCVAKQIETDHERRMRKLDREIAKRPVEIISDQLPAGARRDRHLRYDDSRRRGLTSECICGERGCTKWGWP